VLVTNTAAAPVPVTGNLGQSGTWNVGISGTPPVNVANFPATQTITGTVSLAGSTPLHVVDVPTGERVDVHIQFLLAANNVGDFTALLPIDIVANRILVIDHITAQVPNPPGQDINFTLFIHPVGQSATLGGHAFPAVPLGAATNTQQTYMASVDPRLSAPAGYELVAGVRRNLYPSLNSLFQGTVDYALSGRFVDLQ
jgi:hypothetical protein